MKEKRRNMKIFFVLMTFLFCVPIGAAENSTAVSARAFLESYVSGDFKKASEQIYCPAIYTSEKENEERSQLAGEFSRMASEFGEALSYEVVHGGLYTTVVFGCGPKKDHENIKPIGFDLADIFYEGNKKARIQLIYIKASGKPVLGMVGIGEASIMPGAVMRQFELYEKLKSQPGNGN